MVALTRVPVECVVGARNAIVAVLLHAGDVSARGIVGRTRVVHGVTPRTREVPAPCEQHRHAQHRKDVLHDCVLLERLLETQRFTLPGLPVHAQKPSANADMKVLQKIRSYPH